MRWKLHNNELLCPLVMTWAGVKQPTVPWRQGCSHPTRNQCMGWFGLSPCDAWPSVVKVRVKRRSSRERKTKEERNAIRFCFKFYGRRHARRHPGPSEEAHSERRRRSSSRKDCKCGLALARCVCRIFIRPRTTGTETQSFLFFLSFSSSHHHLV